MNDRDWKFGLSTELVLDSRDPLRWRKQAIFVGKHHDGEQEFECTESMIDHWVETGRKRLMEGIKHPLPVGHTTSEEANRGWIDRFEKDTDEMGRVSLYLGGTARDEEAIKTLKANDISIFAPALDEVAGKVWKRPIKHAAITSYPRVKGLGEFELAMSEPGQEHKGTAEDHVRRLRSHGLTSRNILDALVRAKPEGLVDVLAAMNGPENRYPGDDYESIDRAAFAMAEANGIAYLERDGGDVLIMSEQTDNAFRVVVS